MADCGALLAYCRQLDSPETSADYWRRITTDTSLVRWWAFRCGSFIAREAECGSMIKETTTYMRIKSYRYKIPNYREPSQLTRTLFLSYSTGVVCLGESGARNFKCTVRQELLGMNIGTIQLMVPH
ncbi:hypothetical protein RB195_016302 [Necator americanus]|uniref:Uncharacterized protein n=1 Tax=Necator americanus TaxID=51031 RepID=A0ABR1E8I2_NECAM